MWRAAASLAVYFVVLEPLTQHCFFHPWQFVRLVFSLLNSVTCNLWRGFSQFNQTPCGMLPSSVSFKCFYFCLKHVFAYCLITYACSICLLFDTYVVSLALSALFSSTSVLFTTIHFVILVILLYFISSHVW